MSNFVQCGGGTICVPRKSNLFLFVQVLVLAEQTKPIKMSKITKTNVNETYNIHPKIFTKNYLQWFLTVYKVKCIFEIFLFCYVCFF